MSKTLTFQETLLLEKLIFAIFRVKVKHLQVIVLSHMITSSYESDCSFALFILL